MQIVYKMKRVFLVLVLMVFFSVHEIEAQEESVNKVELEAGFDLATSYLWRGFEIGDGPVVQPWMSVSYGGFSLGAWGTSNVVGDSKEVDLYASYSVKNFTLTLTDYFAMGSPGLDPDFFNFAGHQSNHIAELELSYGGSDQFPLTLSGGFFVYGLALDPNGDDAGKLNHSTYFELGYPGSIKEYDYQLFAGFVPTESSFYETEKFSFINVGCKVSKNIPITAQFSVPTSITLATSPERRAFCITAMCSF